MPFFDDALCFALEKHRGNYRKTSKAPYILHPTEAAAIVSTMSVDDELLSAALLHDTIEDAAVTYEELCEKFSKRVADLVMTETENKRRGIPAENTWQVRKEESLRVLRSTDDEAVKMLWLGDKLSNMRSFYREYLKKGDSLWEGFHQNDPDKQAWYYREIAECLKSLKDYQAYKEYVHLLNIVFENHK